MTGIAAGTHADDDAIDAASAVLGAVGVVRRMEESNLDAVTAVSGTGPAYVFLLAEALTGRRSGGSPSVAEVWSTRPFEAPATSHRTGLGPSELRGQVTSPGGTTAAAMHVLEERGFRALVEDAVQAAAERARELGELAE